MTCSFEAEKRKGVGGGRGDGVEVVSGEGGWVGVSTPSLVCHSTLNLMIQASQLRQVEGLRHSWRHSFHVIL